MGYIHKCKVYYLCVCIFAGAAKAIKKKEVFFHARMNRAGNFSAPGQKPIFNNTVSNIAYGYDHNTGIFTAPETGVYMFFVTVGSTNNPRVEVKVKLILETTELATTRGSDSATAHAVVKVTKGQQVWVETMDLTRFTCLHVITTFTGALL